MLEIKDLHAFYGNIHALKGISIEVEEGEIVTLIGANGAGKSTTLKAISGLLKPKQGSVHLDGEDLEPYPAHEIVYKGVSMVPEGRGIFSRLTVGENLVTISSPGGTEIPGRWNTQWWRATDASHRESTDGKSHPPVDG
jgi:branched-chain amino acid transport system ATP-binding protein